VLLLPRPVGALEARAEVGKARWGDHRGREIRITARLADVDGRPVPGLVPATVTVLGPDGSRSDFSRHTVFRRGALECRIPVLQNGSAGDWRILVQERASGREVSNSVRVQ
jgi:hypothetical protein